MVTVCLKCSASTFATSINYSRRKSITPSFDSYPYWLAPHQRVKRHVAFYNLFGCLAAPLGPLGHPKSIFSAKFLQFDTQWIQHPAHPKHKRRFLFPRPLGPTHRVLLVRPAFRGVRAGLNVRQQTTPKPTSSVRATRCKGCPSVT
jgi:hypothetical protein